MKKILVLIPVIIALFSSCGQDRKGITIQGHVEFADPDFKMCLIRFKDHNKDTIAVVPVDGNNNYKMTVEIPEPGVYTLLCDTWDRLPVWAEDEDLTIDFRGKDTAKVVIKNFPYVLIKGGPKNELINEMNFNDYRHYQNMIAISQAAYAAGFATKEDKDALTTTLYDANEADVLARERYLLDKYATQTSILALISQLDPVRDEELIESSLKKLEAAHPGYKPAADMRESKAGERERKLRMMPGQPAPDFSYAGLDGKETGPATFRGKVLLIDFWASWCGPCRAECPNLKKTYSMFKDKGVEFLSVSLDAKEDAWKKALDEEQMPWPQVLAPKAGAEVMDLYQFNGIPFILLLDQEGKIVAKHLRGEAVGTTIEDLLNGIRPEDRAKAQAGQASSAPAMGMMTPAQPVKAKPASSAPAGGMIPATPIKR